MAAVNESHGLYFDDNESTTSSLSDNNKNSDDSYETEKADDKPPTEKSIINIQWTGYDKRIPVLLFRTEAFHNKRRNFKAVGEQYHLAFKFGTTDCKIVRTILLSHGFLELKPDSQEYNLSWYNVHPKPSVFRFMTDIQKINHFPRSYELTRKDRLFRNIQRMQQMKGYRHFDFIPTSFILPGDYEEFCTSFMKNKGLYIVKPVASSQGRGVFIITHPDEVPLDEHLIVSKYISSPLVIDGYKFDIRVYVAVTSYDPLVIYLYEEGLTRFATVKYQKDTKYIKNQYMHLTNFSVNKRSHDYVKNCDPNVEDYGNKWSMGALLRYLRTKGKNTADLNAIEKAVLSELICSSLVLNRDSDCEWLPPTLEADELSAVLMMEIESVIIKTILSAELTIVDACKLFQPYRGNCFELYGFDILIDQTLKPWVLEVNFCPSLACDTPLDLKIKSNMLCDLLSLVGVVCQDPSMKNQMKATRRTYEVTNRMSDKLRSRSQSSVTLEEHNESITVTGLNSEEIKILRRVKEEESRKGGWVRIFPNADSRNIYGAFLQFPGTHNLMLHQRLFPAGNTETTGNKIYGNIFVKPSWSKNKIPISQDNNGKVNQEKHSESYARALARTSQYERKLKPVRRSQEQKLPIKTQSESKKQIQGQTEVEESEVNESGEDIIIEEAEDAKLQKLKLKDVPSSKDDTKLKAFTRVRTKLGHLPADTIMKENEVRNMYGRMEAAVLGEPHQFGVANIYNKMDTSVLKKSPHLFCSGFDVIAFLQSGFTLRISVLASVKFWDGEVQARTTFATYLKRVQERLLSDWSAFLKHRGVMAVNKQMATLVQFLKCAAENLPPAVVIVVPSNKLPFEKMKRIVSEQLGVFIKFYCKETEQIKCKLESGEIESKKTKHCESLNELQFDDFITTATEHQLEAVLMIHTEQNKSETVFLGMDSRLQNNTLPPGKRELPPYCHGNPKFRFNPMDVHALDDKTHTRQAPNLHVEKSPTVAAHGSVIKQCHGLTRYQGRSPSSYSRAVGIYTQKIRQTWSARNNNTSHKGNLSMMATDYAKLDTKHFSDIKRRTSHSEMASSKLLQTQQRGMRACNNFLEDLIPRLKADLAKKEFVYNPKRYITMK